MKVCCILIEQKWEERCVYSGIKPTKEMKQRQNTTDFKILRFAQSLFTESHVQLFWNATGQIPSVIHALKVDVI